MNLHAGWMFPDADRFMRDQMAPDGSYQRAHLVKALSHVTHHGTAIDGGAHVGTWAKLMAPIFSRVIAVEPSQDTFACLEHNMRAFRCTNVESVWAALGEAPGFVTMDLDDANAARANTGARHVVQGGEVPVVTIDSMGLNDLGFIKLDVEGSEPHALHGAAETIARCRPIVLYENKWMWSKHYGLPKNIVSDFLRSMGYHSVDAIGCDQVWAWKA